MQSLSGRPARHGAGPGLVFVSPLPSLRRALPLSFLPAAIDSVHVPTQPYEQRNRPSAEGFSATG